MDRFNAEAAAQGWPPLRMGVGINTGSAVGGQVGSRWRMNYTVIGSPVNLAARLQGPARCRRVRGAPGRRHSPRPLRAPIPGRLHPRGTGTQRLPGETGVPASAPSGVGSGSPSAGEAGDLDAWSLTEPHVCFAGALARRVSCADSADLPPTRRVVPKSRPARAPSPGGGRGALAGPMRQHPHVGPRSRPRRGVSGRAASGPGRTRGRTALAHRTRSPRHAQRAGTAGRSGSRVSARSHSATRSPSTASGRHVAEVVPARQPRPVRQRPPARGTLVSAPTRHPGCSR